MKICDIWIFHVGRGVAGAIRTPEGKWVAIDLGASDDFCPVKDFLAEKIKTEKRADGRKPMAQLIISHPHNDHMTSLKRYDESFYPDLLSVPNSNHEKSPEKNVNWDRVQNPHDDLTNYLRKSMLPGRTPPLRATKDETDGFNFEIYYLNPHTCENDEALQKTNYPNNISIVARLYYKGNVVLFPGDIMKDGMQKLIGTTTLGTRLEKAGVNFLVAPHHGLRSSFSVDLFAKMKGGKSALNIISEKSTISDSNEIVDERYGLPEYASGHSVHINGNAPLLKRKIRTSVVGHIHIRLFENGSRSVMTGDKIL